MAQKRIQVVVSDKQKKAFEAAAKRVGLNISAWLRMQGLQALGKGVSHAP